MVDVGSSVGGVLAGFKTRLPLEVLGIEPSAREAEYAVRRGIPTQVTMIEEVEANGIVVPQADQILCAQSLNHFLSPRFFFIWAWKHLKPRGRLILEVKNFRQQVRRSGRVENSIQMDHAYMFTPETIRQYLAAAGFRLLTLIHDENLPHRKIRKRQKFGLPAWQIRAVAEKIDQWPFTNMERELDRTAYHKIRASLVPWRLMFVHYFRYGGTRDFLRRHI